MPLLAIPEVAAVIAALMALLIIYGGKQIGEFLAQILAKIPLLGGQAASVVRTSVDVAVSLSYAVLSKILTPAARLILYPVIWVETFIDVIAGSFHVVRDAVVATFTHYLPNLANLIASGVANAVHAAEAYALAQYRDVLARIESMGHAVDALVARAITAAESYAVSLYHDTLARIASLGHAVDVIAASVLAHALAYTDAAIRNVVGLAQSLYHDAVTLIGVEVAKVTALAEGLFTDAITTAQTLAHDAEAAAIKAVDLEVTALSAVAWPVITDEVAAIDQILGTDLPDIAAALRAIPDAIPFDLSTALAAVGALSVPMLRYMRECGIPNCRNLSAFGRALADLEVLIGEGALLAFVVEAAHNPHGFARTLADDLGSVVDGLANGLRDLVGV